MYSGYEPLIRCMIWKYFLLYSKLPFHSVDCVLWCTEMLNFGVIVVSFFCCCCCCCLFIWCHVQGSIDKSNVIQLSPCVLFWGFYSFSSFVSIFDTFWVNFCLWHKVSIQLHSFAFGYPVFPQPFLEETILST